MDCNPTKSTFFSNHPYLSRPIFPSGICQKSPETVLSMGPTSFASQRTDFSLPMKHLLTPETPSFQHFRANKLNFSPLQKKLPSCTKAPLEKSPFRPWDTPQSLSPQSSETASSSPESNKTSPESNKNSSPSSQPSSPCNDLIPFQLSSPEDCSNSSPPFLKSSYHHHASPPSLHNSLPNSSPYTFQLQSTQSFPIDLSETSKFMYASPETKFEPNAIKADIFTQSFLNSVNTPCHPIPFPNTPSLFTPYGMTKPTYNNQITPSFSNITALPSTNSISTPPITSKSIPLKQISKKPNDQNPKRKKKQLKYHEKNAVSASPSLNSKLSRKTLSLDVNDSQCRVCGLKATGVHYGAMACEGCKGFFRRRVISRDVVSLVCGGGGRVQVNGSGRVDGRCQVKGRGRILCRLCRYHSCLDAGMNPNAVRPEKKHKLPFPEQILSLQKDTMEMVPAVYLGRSHGENLLGHLARSYPESADLSLSGAASVRQFITNLPGWEDLPRDEKDFSLSEGSLMVMLLRLLSRYRPECGAFLFPCGQFLFVKQLQNLPLAAQDSLQYLASDLANRGLTKQEMSLLSVLLAMKPGTSLHGQAMQALVQSSSLMHLLMMVPCFGELARQATWESWIKPF